MIVVAEIGNTTIHIAAFEESQMIEDWCLLTPKKLQLKILSWNHSVHSKPTSAFYKTSI